MRPLPRAPPTTFGELLRRLRKRAGMTQDDLAAATGYSRALIGALEQFRRRIKKAGDRVILQFTNKKYVYLEATNDALTLEFHRRVPSEIQTQIAGLLGTDPKHGVIFSRHSPVRGAIQNKYTKGRRNS